MTSVTTRWRVSPAAWLPIALAVAAEATSNALRAYALGTHLDRLTLTAYGVPISLAGGVLVLAAVAVSLTQARAAWVALMPGSPVRQRIVAGLAAALLLAISVTAMASHILEAQRAKVSDEAGDRGNYDRAKTAYAEAEKELKALGSPRAVSVIQGLVQDTKIDMAMWRRSEQCSNVTREDTRKACEPILELYKERGAAARKAELEPRLEQLRAELASLKRPEVATATEDATAGIWAWIMGLGVVFVATFGSAIFATSVVDTDSPPASRPVPTVGCGRLTEGQSQPTNEEPDPSPPADLAPQPAADDAQTKEAKVIDFAKRFEAEKGRKPLLREIQQACHVGKATASRGRKRILAA